MLRIKNFLDSVTGRLEPAEERISKFTTKSRKIPKTRPKEETNTKTKKHNKDQRNQECCSNIKRSNIYVHLSSRRRRAREYTGNLLKR